MPTDAFKIDTFRRDAIRQLDWDIDILAIHKRNAGAKAHKHVLELQKRPWNLWARGWILWHEMWWNHYQTLTEQKTRARNELFHAKDI